MLVINSANPERKYENLVNETHVLQMTQNLFIHDVAALQRTAMGDTRTYSARAQPIVLLISSWFA